MGVNDNPCYSSKHKILSVDSYTTNYLAPVITVTNDKFGIDNGYMTTCHAYTNDQRILDSPHRDPRSTRAVTVSIIPHHHRAAKAIGEPIPDLKGR
jgi:glyceraldehyde 3-phosphate dehydrogenase